MSKLTFENIDVPGESVVFKVYHRHDDTCDVIVSKTRTSIEPEEDPHSVSSTITETTEKRIFSRISTGDAKILAEALRSRV